MKEVLHIVEQVAPTDATVLLLGETGTGKELIARAIHNLNKRKDRILVKVNCAALPATLIESELFGHERGAFTGAITRKTGRFEIADGGTILLYKIGDLPLDLQAKLLRVQQEGEFERLGSDRTLTTDVRVIAATNHDLEDTTDNGNFREDLYYRLNVVPIHLPPLPARKKDIPLFIEYFTNKYSKEIGKTIKTIPTKVMKDLQAYTWPGNVRELENVIDGAVILSPRNVLHIENVFTPSTNHAITSSLHQMERKHILSVLENCNWVIEGKFGAAEALDINPATLRSRMKKLGIERPS